MRKIGHMTYRVLEAIADHIDDFGMPPSFRELGDMVGLSSLSSVSHHITVLRAAELLVNHTQRSRALVPSREGYQAIGRDRHPPSELMPDTAKQPRMHVIPQHIHQALSWLLNDVEVTSAKGRTVPTYLQQIALWWAKIRRSSDEV